MKKTLTTLALAAFALSGVAAAEIVENLIPVSKGGHFWADDYTFTFSIDSASDVLSTGTDLFYYITNSESYGKNKYILLNNSGVLTMQVGRSNITNTSVTDFYSENVLFSTALQTGVTYTVSSVGADQLQTITLTGVHQGNIISETLSYNGNMNGTGNIITSYANTTFNVAAVPEPATATLSLLALAGLAARRRRK